MKISEARRAFQPFSQAKARPRRNVMGNVRSQREIETRHRTMKFSITVARESPIVNRTRLKMAVPAPRPQASAPGEFVLTRHAIRDRTQRAARAISRAPAIRNRSARRE